MLLCSCGSKYQTMNKDHAGTNNAETESSNGNTETKDKG
jgi:hypothetical protein